jgi:hypothetical protein
MVALRMPATSPSVVFHHLGLEALALAVLQVLAQQHAAQSQASVPPAPAWMSTKQFSGSAGLLNMRRNSSCSTVSRTGLASASMAPGRRSSPVGLGHLEQLGVVGQVALQVVDGLDHRFERLLLAAQFLGALGFVPDERGSPARR